MRLICQNCFKEFFYGNKVKYCCGDCKREGTVKLRKQKLKMIKCKICKKQFQPILFSQIYCCKQCSKKGQDIRITRGRNTNYFEILKRDNFTCIYCGKNSFKDKIKLVVDHIYPRKLGGKNDLHNLATCCFDCNIRKGDMYLGFQQILLIWKEIEIRNKSFTPEKYDTIKKCFDIWYKKRI